PAAAPRVPPPPPAQEFPPAPAPPVRLRTGRPAPGYPVVPPADTGRDRRSEGLSARRIFTAIAWLFFAASLVLALSVVRAAIDGRVRSPGRHGTTYSRQAEPWMFRSTLGLPAGGP